MKKFIIFLAATIAAASCASERAPEEKVAGLLTARFDSLALDCKVVSVALKDTIRQKLTKADPEYKRLCDEWYALMDARVSFSSPEYQAAREAMKAYEAAWIGKPIALSYTCIVECDDAMVKMLVESGAFAVDLDHTKILELE